MKKNDHRSITGFALLLVFGLFALCMTALLLTGIRVYGNLTDRAAQSHGCRTAARYLTTRFHQAPNVQLGEFSGLQAMTIREEIGGRTYVTRVYCHEGHIRELFAAESAQAFPGDGEIILPAEELTFTADGQLLTVEITHPDGEVQRLYLCLPDWKEEAP